MRTLHRVPPILVLSWLLVPAAVVLVAVVLLEPSTVMAQDASTAKFTYLFNSDAEGWMAGFADLPVDHDQQFFELDSVHRQLPDGLHQSRGMFMQGHNRSADLFMYLKRRVDGLQPNTTYDVSVSLDLATNVQAGLFGIGSAPGEGVFSQGRERRRSNPRLSEGDNRHLRMNIDKGNQSQGGEDMVVIGNVAHSEVTGSEHRLKTLDNAGQPLSVETDGNGRVWLIVGTDSGFEGLTAIYYARIAYTLTGPEPSPATGGRVAPWVDDGLRGGNWRGCHRNRRGPAGAPPAQAGLAPTLPPAQSARSRRRCDGRGRCGRRWPRSWNR